MYNLNQLLFLYYGQYMPENPLGSYICSNLYGIASSKRQWRSVLSVTHPKWLGAVWRQSVSEDQIFLLRRKDVRAITQLGGRWYQLDPRVPQELLARGTALTLLFLLCYSVCLVSTQLLKHLPSSQREVSSAMNRWKTGWLYMYSWISLIWLPQSLMAI